MTDRAVEAARVVNEILDRRGFQDLAARAEFLSKKPKLTYDPFLLPDVEEGTDTIFASLKAGEKICIYGDYDVDGLMSSVLLYGFLGSVARRLGSESELYWYIPSRMDEGYGLNEDALASIAENGTGLVITVDCGSVSRNEVSFARERGLKIVITDHHDCDAERLPDCPLIDPKAPGSAYPFKGLSGCGVAFKTAQALRLRYFPADEDLRAELNAMLDLVAVATIADVVPLIDENRTLVKYGLAELNARRRAAFSELSAAIKLKGEITSYSVAFGIAPHINAAGRMEDAEPVVKLFVSEDAEERAGIISGLVRNNVERRAVQDKAFEDCVKIVDGRDKGELFLLIRPERVHEGIAGIVAGKLKDAYHRPCAVLSEEHKEHKGDGSFCAMLKGSARSIAGVDIIGMLRSHAELFVKLGGHAMAAGFTLPEANEQTLRDALNADMDELVSGNPALLRPSVRIDAEISASEATIELAAAIDAFEPTGEGNPRPRIGVKDAQVADVRRIGEDGAHISFTADGLKCVFFRVPDEAGARISDGARLSLAGRLNLNTWNGVTTAQLIVDSVV
ncbi:MAG: single-stranded-DNA-specific exonuclease RecJ [Clostridiales Family XIII bacterium]|nr:single-stranded-DNA-specific exonuclease RecJ [Clostridiales Family XIII bacterium]